MGAKEHLQILGIGADGNSKFRKYYLEEFLERPARLNDLCQSNTKVSTLLAK